MPPETLTVSRPASAPRAATRVADLSIVVVNWNTRDYLRDCLRSIYEHHGALRVEVIVIDNASADDSAEMVRREFPNVQLIVNDTNLGFAAANNQGLRLADGRFVLLLNPDTVVLDDVLKRSVEYAEQHPDAGVVGCQVMQGPESVQRTCFRYPSPLHTFLWVSGLLASNPASRLFGRAVYGPWDRTTERDVEVVSGMYMLVRREALEDVGLMDEAFFVFAEEADWCYRFRVRGWRCVFAPVGRILHVDGGSKSTNQVSVKMYVEMQKSHLLFQRRHQSRLACLTTKALFLTTMPLRWGWWGLWGKLGVGEDSAHKAKQSAAATVFHWTGKEPAW